MAEVTLPASTALDVGISITSGRGSAPAGGAATVTTSDTTADPSGPFRYLYVGSAGNVKLTTLENNAVVITGVPAGSYVWCACTRVWATGTTVSSPDTNITGYR